MNIYTQTIGITSDFEVVKIVNLTCETELDFVYLEIRDRSGNVLKTSTFDSLETFLVDEERLPLKILYKDDKKETFDEVVVDELNREVKRNTEEVTGLEVIVKHQMDYPLGSIEEVSMHSKMLQKASYDPTAKDFVIAKIKSAIISSKLVESETNEQLDIRSLKCFNDLYGMGILEPLDSDPEVGEIMVTGTVFPEFSSTVYYIKNGEKFLYDAKFGSLEELKHLFSRTIAFEKKEMNTVENAIIEATRENKDRINIIIPNASEQYILNIRKFSNFVPDADSMKKYGTVNEDLENLFDILVKGKANVGIGGAMATGKTSLINYLLTYTEKSERKVVIASVSETDINRVLKGHDVLILNVDDDKDFTFGNLMKASLRTTASRVIIPESRGSEFRQIYEANLKTKGNMFTAHALDDYSFLDMCVDMYMSVGSTSENSEYVKNKLSKSIDIIVIMKKVGNKIRVKSVSETMFDANRNYTSLSVLYEFVINPENPEEGIYIKRNNMSERLKLSLNENGVPMSKINSWGV